MAAELVAEVVVVVVVVTVEGRKKNAELTSDVC